MATRNGGPSVNPDKGKHESKDAPTDIWSGAKNRTAEMSSGPVGAGEVGNTADNPYGPGNASGKGGK